MAACYFAGRHVEWRRHQKRARATKADAGE